MVPLNFARSHVRLSLSNVAFERFSNVAFERPLNSSITAGSRLLSPSPSYPYRSSSDLPVRSLTTMQSGSQGYPSGRLARDPQSLRSSSGLGGVNWGEPASLSAGLAVEVNNTDRAPIPADRRKGRLVGNTVTDRVLTDNGVVARAG
jgi:hypothetical protein